MSSSSKIIDGSKTCNPSLGQTLKSSSSKIIDGSKTLSINSVHNEQSSSSKIIDGSKTPDATGKFHTPVIF